MALPKNWTSVLANEDGHGFYRVRYSADLLAKLQQTGLHALAPVERFNLLNDTWASTIAGMVPPADYLPLTEYFRGEKDPHVWAVMLGSFSTMNHCSQRRTGPCSAAFVSESCGAGIPRARLGSPPDERELVKELRGDVIRALGYLGS